MEEPTPTEEIPELEDNFADDFLRKVSGIPEPKKHLVLGLYHPPKDGTSSLVSRFPSDKYRLLFREKGEDVNMEAYIARIKDKIVKERINGRVIILPHELNELNDDFNKTLEDDSIFHGFGDVRIINSHTLHKKRVTNKIMINDVFVFRDCDSYLRVMHGDEVKKQEERGKPKTWNKNYGMILIVIVILILFLWFFGGIWFWVILFLVFVFGLYWMYTKPLPGKD